MFSLAKDTGVGVGKTILLMNINLILQELLM